MLALLFCTASATLFPNQQCETPDVLESFDLNQFVGLWYEQYKDPNTIFEHPGDCGTAYYSFRDDGYLDVYNSNVQNG